MAVEDKYINSDLASGKKGQASKVAGGQMLALTFTFETAAADDDGSVYRIARLPANAIPIDCTLYTDSITGMTDIDLGLYKPGVGGAVVDKDLLADGLNLNAGVAITTDANNGLTNLGGADPVASVGKKLWELLGLSEPSLQQYDLAITANTVGSGVGTISGVLRYILGD